MADDLDTSQIREWRSIVTLIVFVITNIIVLFPFYIPIYVPRPLWNALLRSLSALRIISPQELTPRPDGRRNSTHPASNPKRWKKLRFHMGMITAPLIADLFLLAILAIGRQEVHDGTIGANGIAPIDIMVFFLTLAYIAISIDASGLIRWLAFKVLQKGGGNGHRLYVYLYSFFFIITCFVGNDPIVLSGTAFLAYMTRVSANIKHPRAWIHTQFTVANIGSAVLVSSNPTNLVLAGAFEIKFIVYTANVIVPVFVTAILLLPFLLYVIFPYENLIPRHIKLHELDDEAKRRPPVNPNIPNARGAAEDEDGADDEEGKKLSLEEIMNPFLDKSGAWFGGVVMAATLVTILALNASSQNGHEHPVFWITLPAAFIMFCFDLTLGWKNRKETRKIAREGLEAKDRALAKRSKSEELGADGIIAQDELAPKSQSDHVVINSKSPETPENEGVVSESNDEKDAEGRPSESHDRDEISPSPESTTTAVTEAPEKKQFDTDIESAAQTDESSNPKTLVSIVQEAYSWSQVTFPTVTTVATHLPWKLVPFAFCMFVLVQALVTKGWVPVFAHGWDHWVNRTGTVGAIGGMGFLAVVLCNFAGTNIGTTILLCRVVQAWLEIHCQNGTPITQRTFWATVYSMIIGVNYGAFSTAFSASLAGLLWRDILERKHIRVRSLDFARVNLPIIAATMVVGLAVLIGEVYITRNENPYVYSGCAAR